MSTISDFTLPSDPKDIESIKNAIIDISAQEQMIADRKESINEIKKDLKSSYDMPTKLVTQLVKAVDASKYTEMTEEHSVFEIARETILGDSNSGNP